MTANAIKSDTCNENAVSPVSGSPEISGDIIQGPGASSGASEATLPTAHFDWRGKTYRLYKREADKAAPWYFQVKRAGKRIRHSTHSPLVNVAVTKAKAILEASERQQLAAVREILNPRAAAAPIAFCSIAELLEQFDRTPLDIGEKHRKGVRSAIAVVLRQGAGVQDLDKANTWLLNPDTARRYFESALTRSQAQATQAAAGRIKRSANSTWCQAVCLLRPKLLAAYERAGLRLPDVAPFLAVFKEEKFSKCVAVYNPPTDVTTKATLHAWVKLTDRNQFLAVGLALSCGMRRGEMSQVTWSMLTRRHGRPILDGEMAVKNQGGRITVQPIDPFWRVMMRRIQREGWRGKDSETVLTGTKTDLLEDIFRATGAWLRGLGWQTEKTNHALRAFAGCQVAMKFGVYQAQQWLRHHDVKVTQSAYGHFITSAVFNPDQVRIRWAK